MYVHYLSEELARLGHNVAVVYHASTPRPSESRRAYEVVPLPAYPPRRRSDLYRFSRGDVPPGFDIFLDEWKPDIVHFHAFTLGAGLDHSREVRRREVPYFLTYHTPAISCPRGTLMYRGLSACDGRMDAGRCAACVLEGQGWPMPFAALLAHSPVGHAGLPDGPWLPRLALPSLLDRGQASWQEFMAYAEYVIACAGWCKEVLVRNGVPSEKVSVVRQGLPGPSRTRRLRLPLSNRCPLRVGFFGRFTWVKGPDLLLEAAAKLRQRGLTIRCELAGPINGDEEQWAKRLLRRFTDGTVYHGLLCGEAVRAWLRDLDLVVVPSRWLETGPLTLLEAWDEGVPVIGTKLGGIDEFLGTADLDQLTFQTNDAANLANVIEGAARWPSRENPEVLVPGMAEVAERMVGLYEHVCGVSTNAEMIR
jgi:glycosyltransferase involved in cell wall biosynthesis